MRIFSREKKEDPNFYYKKNEELNIRLQAIAEVNELMAGVIGKEEVFDLITKKLAPLVKMNFPTIWIFNDADQTIRLASHSVPDSIRVIAEKSIGKPLNQIIFSKNNSEQSRSTYFKVIEQGKPIFSDNLYEHTYPFLNEPIAGVLERLSGMKLAVSVPIMVKGKPIGVLSAIWQEAELSKENEITLYTFANQISTAVYNSQLFEQVNNQVNLLTQQNHDLSSLYNLTSNIMKSLDPDIVAQTAVDSLPQDMSMIGAVLGMHDPKTNQIFVKAFTQNQFSRSVQGIIGDFSQYKADLNDEKFANNVSAKAFKFGTIYWSNDIGDFISPPVPSQLVGAVSKILNIKSVVSYPISSRGKNVGVITYLLKEKSYDQLTENEKQLYTTYTYQIAIALENADLLKNLELAKAQIEEAFNKERDMMDILGHELRTPLAVARNAILMMDAEFQKPNPDMVSIRDLLEKSKENIRREIKTLQTVLSTTRLENNRSQINFEKIDAKDVVNDSVEAFMADAKKKALELQVILPKEELFIWAGREQIQEIMDNLLSNAIKYTPKGSVKVTLSQDPNFIILSVADTGEGIPESEMKNLGKKFHRINPYVKSGAGEEAMKVVRPGGTGIGLYVVTGFLKSMGGRLEVQSQLGAGSNFIASLPKYTGQDQLAKK